MSTFRRMSDVMLSLTYCKSLFPFTVPFASFAFSFLGCSRDHNSFFVNGAKSVHREEELIALSYRTYEDDDNLKTLQLLFD